MRQVLPPLALLVLLGTPPLAEAGLYYSGETFAELPSQWRGFLLDQRMLRTIAVKPIGKAPPNPARGRYEAAAAKLAKLAAKRPLTADEAADLGALYIRLGDPGRALEVLRPAQRAHPKHFRLSANLGTAWQLHGDLAQAAAALGQAVRLAPEKLRKAEELHLKLVRLRDRASGTPALDDLFGVRYVGPLGKYEPGQLAVEQRKRLPASAVAVVQQLALWLPADGPLLWQLAELTGAHGDPRTAAAIMDGCVTEFGMRARDLRDHRRAMRSAADKLPRGPSPANGHGEHAVTFKPRSLRPLVRKTDASELPPIDPKGVNALPWSVVGETAVDRRYRPTFPKYLQALNGKRVMLRGFMQPLRDEDELSDFMLIEYPIGCWYCEQPDMVNIVLVELPAGKTQAYLRGQVSVTGKLVLNATDPENFLYILRDAKVTGGE